MTTKILISFLVILTVATVSQCKSINKLDEGSIDIANIALLVCSTDSGFNKQITKPQTVLEVIDYLLNSRSLASCVADYKPSLEALKNVIEEDRDDVCGSSKLEAIIKFHSSFVFEGKTDKVAPGEIERAPKLLRTFFMQYAMEVGEICKRNLIKNMQPGGSASNVDWLASGADSEEAKLANEIAKAVQTLSDLCNYDDIVLLWDLIKLPKAKNSIAEAEPVHDPDSADEIKAMAKVRSGMPMRLFQRICRLKYRPVYSPLVLPLVHLSNLGYVLTNQPIVDTETTKKLETLYSLTQFCEILTPMKFYDDGTMKTGQFVVITSEEDIPVSQEAEDDVSLDMQATRLEPSKLSVDLSKEMSTIGSSDAQKVVQRYKTNRDARLKKVKHLIRVVAKCFITKCYKKLVNSGKSGRTLPELVVMTSRSAKGDRVATDVTAKIGEALNKADAIGKEELGHKLEESSVKRGLRKRIIGALTRSKRGIARDIFYPIVWAWEAVVECSQDGLLTFLGALVLFALSFVAEIVWIVAIVILGSFQILYDYFG